MLASDAVCGERSREGLRLARLRVGLLVPAAVVCLLVALTAPAGARPARAAEAGPYVAVSANHLVDAGGAAFRLRGVDRSGTEYMCKYGEIFDGPSTTQSIVAMAAWHINAVRLPLNEDCWLGINGVKPSVSGAAYQTAIEEYVARLQSFGLIVILDLHWAAPSTYVPENQWPMADADHAPAFWTSVASAFKGNHGVIFDLFNEPYITSWSCWRSGCEASHAVGSTTVNYQTAGMQSLLDAVRATGATQPIMLGGLKWAADESQWSSFTPSDPAKQLVVSFHTYDFTACNTESCWNSTIAPLAQQVPVVTGEFGQSGCKRTYVEPFMNWADAHGVSYLGWTWDATAPPSGWTCSGGPALIKNWEGRATAYGAALKKHLTKLFKRGQLVGP